MASTVIAEGEFIQKDDPLNDDRDQQQELFDLYDDMNEGDRAETWISVTRIPMDSSGNSQPNSKHAGHLFQAALGTMSASDIIIEARKFIRIGQTSIMIRVRGSKKGQRGSLFNKIFVVERKNDGDEKPAGDATSNLFKLIQDNQRVADERNREFMDRLLGMQARVVAVAPVDPLDQMTKMMTAMGGMMAAMMGGRPMGAAPPQESATAQLLGMVTVMQKLGVMGGEPVEKDEGLGDIIKAVAGPALAFFAEQKRGENLKLAQAGNNRPKRLAPPQRIAPLAPPANDPNVIIPPVDPAAQTPTIETKEKEMELAQLKSALAVIFGMAARNEPVADVSRLILNTVPQEQEGDFFEQISDDGYVSQCVLLEPRLDAHREWLEAVRQAMLAEFSPDEANDPPGEVKTV